MVRRLLIFNLLFPVVLFAASPEVTTKTNAHGEAVYMVKYDGGEAVVVNPALTALNRRGSRFSHGGWIDSLKVRQGRELLEQTGIFPWHPGWGMPLEFTVTPEIGKTESNGALLLRPGIGVVELAGQSVIREHFPWTTEVVENKTLRFIQEGDARARAYRLTIELRFADGSESFSIHVALENRGSTELIVANALHPFLRPAADHGATRISLPTDSGEGQHDLALTEFGFHTVFRKRVPSWIATRNVLNGGALRIRTEPAADELVLWRSHGTENFAIEPVIKRLIPPGERAEWSFEVATRL